MGKEGERLSKHFPNSFYRVSVKGLCVRDGKLLLAYDATCRRDGKDNARWELPGGGMDFGEGHKETIAREVKEEMGLEVTKIADEPTYFWTYKVDQFSRGMEWYWVLLLGFRFDVKDLNFTPSDECQEFKFYDKEELQTLDLNDQVEALRDIFNPADFEKPF